MKRWIAGVALAAGLAGAGTAVAGEHYVVAIEDDRMVMLDLETEVRSGARLEIVATWVYRSAENGVQYEVEKIELDCDRTRIRILEHAGHDRGGKVIDTSGQTSWHEMPPESIGYELINTACHADRRQAGQTVDAEPSVLIEQFLNSPPPKPVPTT